MKNSYRKFLLLLSVFSLITACEKWIDTDINIDPNRPVDVPLNLLLPSIQANLAYEVGGNDAVRVTGILMQHLDGVGRQSLAQGHYNINNSDPNNLWNTMYAGVMNDLVIMINKGEDAESSHWTGIGKIMLAQSIGFITDLWGDVPFSEAFRGTDQFHPVFDQQQLIYTEIISLLDDGLADLDEDNAVPISGDMIYDGDIDLWKKAARSLKARYLIHTVNVAPAVKGQIAALVDAGFANIDEDMDFQYGTNGSTEASPLFQFMQQRSGDITMCATLIDFLAGTSDPRLPVYSATDAGGLYRGSPAGAADESASVPNPAGIYWRANGITTLVSYAEIQFIKAEALLGTDNDGAAAAYKIAVRASLDKYGVFDQTWFDNNIAVETGATITLQKIIRQKWVAMFSQVEVYNDWRRSNNEIGLALAQDELIGQIPYAYPYPTNEQTLNINCPQGRDLVRKMWWMGAADPSPKAR